MQANTVNVSALKEAALVRKVLDTLALRMDGKPAGAATVSRESGRCSPTRCGTPWSCGLLDVHPLSLVSWTAPKKDEGVDRAVVASPQAAALLAEVAKASPELEAFFGCMYYAGLRPEEVLHLSDDEFERPPTEGAWGWLHLSGATVAVGHGWNDSDEVTEDRGLKHRAKTATRSVPVAPPLAEMLTRHVAKYTPADNGRLFVTRRGPWGRYIPARRTADPKQRLHDSVAQSTRGGPHSRPRALPARQEALRPTSRLLLDVAQRGGAADAGRGVGGQQRQGALGGLRQMPRRRDSGSAPPHRPGAGAQTSVEAFGVDLQEHLDAVARPLRDLRRRRPRVEPRREAA